MSQVDLRVVKTKRNLYQALLTLMKEKSFEEIKVSDICQVALTNRSTFYDHFNDKYDLLDTLFSDLKKQLELKLSENNTSNIKEYYLKLIELFFIHIEENIETYSAIIKKNDNSIVMDMIYDTILKNVKDNITSSNSNIPLEITYKFYISGVINVCMEYLKYPKKYKKEDIISYFNILLPDKFN